MWLHRFELVPAVILAAALLSDRRLVRPGGRFRLEHGAAVYHATFCINSLAHVHGRKRYVTGDDSRNNWLLALFTMGEGWHNNHHAYQSSVRQGFRWWEIDATFYILKALSLAGIVWDLKTPPAEVLRNEQRLGSRVVKRAAEQLAARFNPERIALADLGGAALVRTDRLARGARFRPGIKPPTCWRRCIRAGFPTRDELLAQAQAMFARTRSLDEIVDRAYQLLLGAVGARLVAAQA